MTLSEAGSADAAFPCVRTALARVRRVTKSSRSSLISVLCSAMVSADQVTSRSGVFVGFMVRAAAGAHSLDYWREGDIPTVRYARA